MKKSGEDLVEHDDATRKANGFVKNCRIPIDEPSASTVEEIVQRVTRCLTFLNDNASLCQQKSVSRLSLFVQELSYVADDNECAERTTQGNASSTECVQLLHVASLPDNIVNASLSNDYTVRVDYYRGERDLPAIMQLMEMYLSEPYSIYTYRYFIHNWPNMTFVVR